MTSRKLLLAAMAALLLLCHVGYAADMKAQASTKTATNWPDLPKIGGIPAMFGTVASTTGTMTQYIEVRPVIVGPDGSVKVNIASFTGGEIDTRITSFSVPLPAGTNTLGSMTALPSDGASFPVNLVTPVVTVSDVPLATPTVSDVESTATSASISNTAGRVYIVIQNKAATESAYVYPGALATPGMGIEVQAGSSITRSWGDTVTISYASTGTVPLCIDQEVAP